MGSWRSSSSKGLSDPYAMGDLEDQLDYEPEGTEQDVESDSDNDIMVTKRDYLNNFQAHGRKSLNQERTQDQKGKNEIFLQDQDSRHQFPEPSGQEDQDASNQTSSDRQSLNYGTDLERARSITPSYHSERQSLSFEADVEKVPSMTASFRDKINYTNLHIDVEEGSCRSKFGRHSKLSESFRLDSSDEEEEIIDDSEDALVAAGIQNCDNTHQSPANLTDKNSSDLESYVSSKSPEAESQTLEDDCAGSEDSQTGENIVSPNEIGDKSPESCNHNDSNVLPNFDQESRNTAHHFNSTERNNPVKDTTAVLSPKKRTAVNFSIKVVGNERICLIPKTITTRRRWYKPWVCTAGEYMDNSDVVKLSSRDEVIRFVPESGKSDVKSRLGTPDNRSSYTSEADSVFKTPLKRPPMRQRANSKNFSVSIDLKSQQRLVEDTPPQNADTENNQEDKDDIISLMASSCHLSVAGDSENFRDRRSDLLLKKEPLSLPGSSSETERARVERTAQWVSKAAEPTHTGVPAIYKGLCYNFFLNNRCNNKMCSRSHLLESPLTQIKNLPYLNTNLLMEAYQYAKDHPFLYGQIYKKFAEVFAVKDMKNELVNMVHIIFEECSHRIDQEEGLSTVLNALQKTNLKTFEDTVEYLLLQIGLKRYLTLGNKLLEIICKKPDLVHHWPIIRRLIIAGEKMTHKLGTKFLIHLMKSPVDLKVCREVYNHILTYKCIDLPKISTAIREPFLKICSQENLERETAAIEANIERNLRKERTNFERTLHNSKYSNQILLPDFSKPPPTASFGRPQMSQNLNYHPQTEFGSGLSHQLDFASVSRQKKTFLAEPSKFPDPSPTFEAPFRPYNSEDGGNQSSGSFRDEDFRYRRPETREQRYSINESSDGVQSQNARPLFSDSESNASRSSPEVHVLPSSSSRKRHVHPVLMYNSEGLQYDPANDYALPPKKRNNTKTIFGRSKESGMAFEEPYQDVLGAGPAFPRPNHNGQGAGPAFPRTNHNEQVAGLAFPRPNHNEQGAGPAFPRTNHNEQGAGPAFPRTNHNEQGAGLAFPRPNHNEQGAGPAFPRTNHNEQGAGPAFPRPNHNEQGAGPAFQNVIAQNERATNRGDMRPFEFSVRSNEATVSSCIDAKLRDEKPPEHPRFGDFYFDPNYEFNVSLHNLYLQAIDNVDIDEDDVHRLNDCVKQSDGQTFLTLVEKYKGPKTIQNFISMTLAHLKGMNQMVARTYQSLLDRIEKENRWFYGNIYIRVILEVITMNLLFELNQRNMLEEAKNFLYKFSNWDSLVTSRLFIHSRGVSIIGRYLFIAKILSHSKPELTYEILVCPKLHLLEKVENWPYHPPCPIPDIFNADLELRNNVITNFLKTGYLLNTVVVVQLYKTAFRKKIFDFDVKSYVDPMILDLINRNQILSLKHINNEINLFYKYMARDTLRALLISMYKHVGKSDLFMLYNKCVERKIYQRCIRADSLDYTIEVRTNMHICEIELIIRYYFEKLVEIKKVPSGSEPLRFEIKLSVEPSSKSLPFLNHHKSILQTEGVVIRLVKEVCRVIDGRSVQPGTVEVRKEQLIQYLDQIWT